MPHRATRRRAPTSGLSLQPRDVALIEAVHRYRYVRSDHLASLLFSGRTLRVCQGRLHKLREHRFLERFRLTAVVNEDGRVSADTRPVYGLGVRGAELMADRLHIPSGRVAYGFHYRGSGAGTLEHHLIVTDFLVAVSCAARRETSIRGCTTEHEWALWARLDAIGSRPPAGAYVVPDGALTLTLATGEKRTYYVEVVRAGVRGGNRGLAGKMQRYLALARSGFFRRAYGHERLRAVLFLTSSDGRAENLRQVAAFLPHGQQLFWFGSYATVAPDSFLDARWRTATGELVSFLPSAPDRPSVPGTPDIELHHVDEKPPAVTDHGRAASRPRGDDMAQPVPPVRPLWG